MVPSWWLWTRAILPTRACRSTSSRRVALAATPALLSGQAPFSTSAAAAITASLQGAPLKIIFVNGDRLDYQLWSTTPSVTTLADLVGKSVGATARGDSSELAIRILLQNQGIDPNSVSFTALGTTGGGPPSGVLIDDLQKDVTLLFNGVVTTDQEIQQNPDEVLGFMRATAEGRAYFLAYKDQTLAILAKYNHQTDATNSQDYDATVPLLTPDGTIPDDALLADAQARAAVIGVAAAQVPPVSALCDFAPIRQANQELASSGWTSDP